MGMLFRYHNNIDIKTKDKGASNEVVPILSEDKPKKNNGITASEIKSMNGTKLRKLAKENGISDPEDLTVGELKAILVDKFS